MYLRNCLLEIKERLGRMTKERGLRHRLEALHGDQHIMVFDQRDEDGVLWRAPVSFTFPPPSVTGQTELTFDKVLYGHGESVRMSVGTNGATYCEGYIEQDGHPICSSDIPTVSDAFRLARTRLKMPLFPVQEDLPGYMHDRDIALLWPALNRVRKQFGIEHFEVHRRADSDWREAYHFEYLEKQMEIRSDKYWKIELVVDGEAHYLGDDEYDVAVPFKEHLRRIRNEFSNSLRL